MSSIRTDHPAVVLGLFETGLGVVRSLGRQGIRVRGFDHKKDIGFYSKYVEAGVCPHPTRDEPEFVNFLVRFSDSEKHKPVLFVTSDEFLSTVSRHRDRLQKYFLFNLSAPQLLEAITDKYRQVQLAEKVGCAVPKTYFPENVSDAFEIADELRYPVFIKAREVNAWRHTVSGTIKGFAAHSLQEMMSTLRWLFSCGAKVVIQEMVLGPDSNHYKVCCYRSAKGEPLLGFVLRKLRQNPIRFGVGSLVESIQQPELLRIGTDLFKAIGYRGVGSVEFKKDERDGQFKLIEINPRYWQQNALAERCGMNFPLMDYLSVTGQNPTAIREYVAGVKWANIYMELDSFLSYRSENALTLRQWLASLRGKKVFSDAASDDWLPGFYEIGFGKKLVEIFPYLYGKLFSKNGHPQKGAVSKESSIGRAPHGVGVRRSPENSHLL